MTLIKCSECGTKMSNEAKCCPECGAPNEKLEIECPDFGVSNEELKIKCPECGTSNVKLIIECPECGGKFKTDDDVCPECGGRFKTDDDICSKCGYNQSEKSSLNYFDKKDDIKFISLVAIIIIVIVSIFIYTSFTIGGTYVYGYTTIKFYRYKTCYVNTGETSFDCTYKRRGNTLKVYNSDGELLENFTIVEDSLITSDGYIFEKE